MLLFFSSTREELRNIASLPEYVFEVDSYSALDTLREFLLEAACKGEIFVIILLIVKSISII